MVDAAEGQCRPLVAALSGVVVDDVEDHLDAGLVERADHVLELPHLLAEGPDRAVGGVRGEVSDGVVAPVVAQPAADEERLGDEVLDREQFHRGDAEGEQVIEHRRMSQPGVGPAEVFRHGRVQLGVALDVQFVEHRVGHRYSMGQRSRRRGVGHHHAERNRTRGVALVGDVVGFGRVVPDRSGIVDVGGDRPRVRVEQQLGRVEPGARVRGPGAVHSVAVPLLGTDARHVDGPRTVAPTAQIVVLLPAICADQGELDPSGARRPQPERRAAALRTRAESGVLRRGGRAGRRPCRLIPHSHTAISIRISTTMPSRARGSSDATG